MLIHGICATGTYLCFSCADELVLRGEGLPSGSPWAYVPNADTPRTCASCGEPHGPELAPEGAGNPNLDPWDMPEVEL